MALMAGMMLAGCSKSDDDPTPQYKLTKDNIVGVWRSGDYWASFSSDGYMSAYLSDKCIAEGDYTVDGDTVKVDDGYQWIKVFGKKTRFIINSISNSTLSLTATYNNLHNLYVGDENLEHQVTQSYTFSKSQDAPCTKSNPLVGRVCKIPMNIWYSKWDNDVSHYVPALTQGTCTITAESYNLMDVWILPIIDDGNNAGDHLKYLYVYLPPKLYMISIGQNGGYYEYSRPLKIYEPTFNSDGSLTIPYTYYGDLENTP